jgi:alcohol dehydrogenase, propanol-preferring
MDRFQESQNIIEDVQVLGGGLGPHAAIIIAGHVRLHQPSSYKLATQAEPLNQAPMYLRPTGTLVMVSVPRDAFLHFPVEVIIGKVGHSSLSTKC